MGSNWESYSKHSIKSMVRTLMPSRTCVEPHTAPKLNYLKIHCITEHYLMQNLKFIVTVVNESVMKACNRFCDTMHEIDDVSLYAFSHYHIKNVQKNVNKWSGDRDLCTFIVKCGIFLLDHTGRTSFICTDDFVEE
jgi:hypothetical protein